MTISNDRRSVFALAALLVALAALAASCAHRREPVVVDLWSVCRDACEVQGGIAAAVVGPTKPKAPPHCMCGAPAESL